MTSKEIRKSVFDYLILTFGVVVFCIGWETFLIPNRIAAGGVTGLCTIIQYATLGKIPVSASYFTLNSILLIAAFLILGRGFGFKTIYCILLSSVLFAILPEIEVLHAIEGQPLYISEKVLVPIVGGLVEGIGLFIVFSKGGSTGGSDIVALVLNKFWPVTPGKVFICTDLLIITSILFLPGRTLQDMIYGYICMIASSLVLDFLLLGSKSTVQVLIFSKEYPKIADYITKSMDRGVTAVKAIGWYTGEDRNVLLVLLRKTQLSELTKVVKRMDRDAFMSVSQASSVYGEGFDEFKVGIQRGSKKKGPDE